MISFAFLFQREIAIRLWLVDGDNCRRLPVLSFAWMPFFIETGFESVQKQANNRIFQ